MLDVSVKLTVCKTNLFQKQRSSLNRRLLHFPENKKELSHKNKTFNKNKSGERFRNIKRKIKCDF